jgi:hypothetical protein
MMLAMTAMLSGPNPLSLDSGYGKLLRLLSRHAFANYL